MRRYYTLEANHSEYCFTGKFGFENYLIITFDNDSQISISRQYAKLYRIKELNVLLLAIYDLFKICF